MIWRPEKSGRRYFFSKVTLTPSKLHLRMVHYYLEVQTMSKTILIIEDEEAIQSVVKAFLEDEGYNVVLASDGLEGMEKFHEYRPDLIMLDLMLPKMNGFSVWKAIGKESQVPIIMLTALDDDASQMKGFDALAADYVTKPFSMPLVVKHIEAVLSRAVPGPGVETRSLRIQGPTLAPASFPALVIAALVSLTPR